MTTGVQTIIYPAKDLQSAKAVFTALLGAEPMVDQPYYVGWKVAGQDVGLDPNGHSHGVSGPVPYWHVPDIEAAAAALVAAGATEVAGIREVGPGRRTAVYLDQNENKIGLLQDA